MTTPEPQLGLFAAAPNPTFERLRKLDPNRLTPMKALEVLAQIVEEAKRSGA
jgi:hypothetical protein